MRRDACHAIRVAVQIYLLDFGIARKFINAKGEVRTPRRKAAFKVNSKLGPTTKTSDSQGTGKFCSLNCHKKLELGPSDDCESWFYMVLDCISYAGQHATLLALRASRF